MTGVVADVGWGGHDRGRDRPCTCRWLGGIGIPMTLLLRRTDQRKTIPTVRRGGAGWGPDAVPLASFQSRRAERERLLGLLITITVHHRRHLRARDLRLARLGGAAARIGGNGIRMAIGARPRRRRRAGDSQIKASSPEMAAAPPAWRCRLTQVRAGCSPASHRSTSADRQCGREVRRRRGCRGGAAGARGDTVDPLVALRQI